MTKEELFREDSNINFMNMTESEAWLYYNVLTLTNECKDDKLLVCEFKKDVDIVSFFGNVKDNKGSKYICGYIIEDDQKFNVLTSVEPFIGDKKKYMLDEIVDYSTGEVIKSKTKKKVRR